MDLASSDDSDMSCPLCLEEMDSTDRKFQPCQCGYQICLWCWHHIMEMAAKDGLEGRCPACRSPYDKEKIVSAAPGDKEDLVDSGAEKKPKFGKGRTKGQPGSQVGAAAPPLPDARKQLANVRVVQRNLVYVVGMPYSLADEETLGRREFFGQYGRILKIAVSRSSAISSAPGTLHGATANVYVTFVREEDALRCIHAVDGSLFEGRTLRACFGTTKYCNAWLKNLPCPNPDCLYLHEVGHQEDSYLKDEVLHSKLPPLYDAGPQPNRRAANGLPPPLDGHSAPEKPPLPPSSSAVGSAPRHPHPVLGPALPSKSSTVGGLSGAGGSGTGSSTGILPPAASWGAKGAAVAGKLILSTPKPPAQTQTQTQAQAQAQTQAQAQAQASGNLSLLSGSSTTQWGQPAAAPAAWPPPSSQAQGLPGPGPGSAQQLKPSAAVMSSRVIQASALAPPTFGAANSGAGQQSSWAGPGSAVGLRGPSPLREKQRKSPPSPAQNSPPRTQPGRRGAAQAAIGGGGVPPPVPKGGQQATESQGSSGVPPVSRFQRLYEQEGQDRMAAPRHLNSGGAEPVRQCRQPSSSSSSAESLYPLDMAWSEADVGRGFALSSDVRSNPAPAVAPGFLPPQVGHSGGGNAHGGAGFPLPVDPEQQTFQPTAPLGLEAEQRTKQGQEALLPPRPPPPLPPPPAGATATATAAAAASAAGSSVAGSGAGATGGVLRRLLVPETPPGFGQLGPKVGHTSLAAAAAALGSRQSYGPQAELVWRTEAVSSAAASPFRPWEGTGQAVDGGGGKASFSSWLEGASASSAAPEAQGRSSSSQVSALDAASAEAHGFALPFLGDTLELEEGVLACLTEPGSEQHQEQQQLLMRTQQQEEEQQRQQQEQLVVQRQQRKGELQWHKPQQQLQPGTQQQDEEQHHRPQHLDQTVLTALLRAANSAEDELRLIVQILDMPYQRPNGHMEERAPHDLRGSNGETSPGLDAVSLAAAVLSSTIGTLPACAAPGQGRSHGMEGPEARAAVAKTAASLLAAAARSPRDRDPLAAWVLHQLLRSGQPGAGHSQGPTESEGVELRPTPPVPDQGTLAANTFCGVFAPAQKEKSRFSFAQGDSKEPQDKSMVGSKDKGKSKGGPTGFAPRGYPGAEGDPTAGVVSGAAAVPPFPPGFSPRREGQAAQLAPPEFKLRMTKESAGAFDGDGGLAVGADDDLNSAAGHVAVALNLDALWQSPPLNSNAESRDRDGPGDPVLLAPPLLPLAAPERDQAPGSSSSSDWSFAQVLDSSPWGTSDARISYPASGPVHSNNGDMKQQGSAHINQQRTLGGLQTHPEDRGTVPSGHQNGPSTLPLETFPDSGSLWLSESKANGQKPLFAAASLPGFGVHPQDGAQAFEDSMHKQNARGPSTDVPASEAFTSKPGDVPSGFPSDRATSVAAAAELEPWQLLPDIQLGEGAEHDLSCASTLGLAKLALPRLLAKSTSNLTVPSTDSTVIFKTSSRRFGGGRYGFGLEPEDDN